MKPTVLLTTALFLLSAPAPDSKVISEISAGFLSAPDHAGLLASQDEPLSAVQTWEAQETYTGLDDMTPGTNR